MTSLHARTFPGESKTYRTQRNKLLQQEIKLRKQIEDVAVLRRALRQDGAIKEDYVFDEMSAQWKLFDYTPEGRGRDWNPKYS